MGELAADDEKIINPPGLVVDDPFWFCANE